MEQQLFLGTKPVEELMQPIKNADFVKANGGLWTSSYNNGKSDWIEWCESANFWTTDNQTKWLLTVNENAKVLKIDAVSDLKRAYEKYGYSPYRAIHMLNYEKIAKDYDGIWLTSKGQWETRFSFPISLYGWDCECTHWFRWVFDKVEQID